MSLSRHTQFLIRQLSEWVEGRWLCEIDDWLSRRRWVNWSTCASKFFGRLSRPVFIIVLSPACHSRISAISPDQFRTRRAFTAIMNPFYCPDIIYSRHYYPRRFFVCFFYKLWTSLYRSYWIEKFLSLLERVVPIEVTSDFHFCSINKHAFIPVSTAESTVYFETPSFPLLSPKILTEFTEK